MTETNEPRDQPQQTPDFPPPQPPAAPNPGQQYPQYPPQFSQYPNGQPYPNPQFGAAPPGYPNANPNANAQYGNVPYANAPYANAQYGNYGPYSGGPYGYPQGYYPQQQRGTSGLAIASLVLGICGFLCVTPFVGLSLGIAALSRISKTGQPGKGMAIAGIILSALWIVLLILLIATGNFHIGTGPSTPGPSVVQTQDPNGTSA